MKITNISKNTIIGSNINIANTFYKRLIGLMFKKSINKDEGLLISPCNSIHMFFMKFSIDVIFIDKNDKILYVLEDFKPWRISKIVLGSKYVLELPPKTIKNTLTTIGDIIKIQK